MGCDFDVDDLFFGDFEDDVWYLCDEDEDEEYGEDCGFEYDDFDFDEDCLVDDDEDDEDFDEDD